MVTINSEIQSFYDNMNGNLENLNAKISNLMESIDILKKNNASFSESLSTYYKGQAQDTIVQNLTAISNRLDLLRKIIKKYDSKAFMVVNETMFVQNGYFGLNK